MNTSALQFLASCVPGRDVSAVLAEMPDGRAWRISTARPINAASIIKKFQPRRYQRSADREASRRRRLMLSQDGAMPPHMRAYTTGEAAVLTVIAGEVKRQGICDWPIDKIAALAGVCRTTAQNAMREARRRGHISVERRPVKGRKSDTNIVRIISREWITWIKLGPGIGFKTISGSNFLSPTKIKDSKQEGIRGKQEEFPRVARILRVSG
jgi:hypothetical protein